MWCGRQSRIGHRQPTKCITTGATYPLGSGSRVKSRVFILFSCNVSVRVLSFSRLLLHCEWDMSGTYSMQSMLRYSVDHEDRVYNTCDAMIFTLCKSFLVQRSMIFERIWYWIKEFLDDYFYACFTISACFNEMYMKLYARQNVSFYDGFTVCDSRGYQSVYYVKFKFRILDDDAAVPSYVRLL